LIAGIIGEKKEIKKGGQLMPTAFSRQVETNEKN
jgi:hypothetical protein